MFTQTPPDMILLLMLYAMGATVSAMACVYLLLRKGNAFTRHIQTPRRLRLWTAAFFGIVALSHVWYMPAGLVADGDAVTLWMLVGGLLDCLLTIPLAIAVMPWVRGYFALMGLGLIVYMVREVRRYGRWLRDNVTAQELARQSGYRSYRTFSLAFKQRMGRPVTDWQKLQFAVSK